MKKMIRYIAMLSVAAMLAVMLPGKVYALGTGEWLGIQGDLNPKGLGAAGIAKLHGDAAAMDYIKECNSLHPGAIPPDEIETILDQGYLSGYVDELKELGYISQNYSGGGNTTSVQEGSPTPEPAAFTVEDMPETSMWAASEVNYRDGASTDYNKIGSLAKDEEVKVNGRASTGWYRFVLADGTEAYVSDKYLTAEDPNEAPEPEKTAPEPEPEEEPVVEEPKVETPEPEPVVEEPKTEMPEPEPVVEEPEQIVEPPVVEETTGNWIPIAVGVAAAVCVIGGVSFVLIRRKKD